MVLDDDKRILEYIETLVNQIKSKRNNLSFAYKSANEIIKISNKLHNKVVAFYIKDKASLIMQTGDVNEIQNVLDELLIFISKSFVIVNNNPRPYINADKIEKTKKYMKDCEKYIDHIDQIEEMEQRIITSSFYQKKLHKPIIHGEWTEALHAHLTDNLRIMYYWYPKKKILVYEAIITHDELDKSLSR